MRLPRSVLEPEHAGLAQGGYADHVNPVEFVIRDGPDVDSADALHDLGNRIAVPYDQQRAAAMIAHCALRERADIRAERALLIGAPALAIA